MPTIYENISNVIVYDKDGKPMSERDLKERVFQRHDQFDYQRFIIDEHWYVRPTIVMLTSFYMEVNGLFDQGDPVETFAKIYSNYMNFIVYRGLLEGPVQFANMDEDNSEPDAVDLDSARFRREELYTFIENNNIIRLNVDRLKRFISGEEKPATPISAVLAISKSKPDVAIAIEKSTPETFITPTVADEDIQIEPDSIKEPDNQYCFMKTDKGWDLQFEDVVLRGVKNLRGMKYIKKLLEHPNEKIDVFKLQEFAGEASYSEDEEQNNDDDFDGDHNASENTDELNDNSSGKETPKVGVNAWISSDQKAVDEYKVKLSEAEDKLKVALACNIRNKSKIQRLEKDIENYEKYIREASYRPKDPQVELNRKRLLNSITYAIKNIGKLEKLSNNYDKPMFRHLRRHIRTGSSCSYYINKDEAPLWKF